jgi:hypothetical protein
MGYNAGTIDHIILMEEGSEKLKKNSQKKNQKVARSPFYFHGQ